MRFSHQSFTDLPNFGTPNQLILVIDSEEMEGKFSISEYGQFLKFELHSLSNKKWRENYVHKLSKIIEACNIGIQAIQSLEPAKSDKLPPLNPKSDEANA
jgi:hypothetical protein